MGAQGRKTSPGKVLPSRTSRDKLIARAEEALDGMRDEFSGWIQEETNDLSNALSAWVNSPQDPERTDDLFRRAHDLKGQAPTLGYPIVGRLANSLCHLLGCKNVEIRDLVVVAQNHVNAIEAAVRGEVRDDTDTTAAALATELENIVNALYT